MPHPRLPLIALCLTALLPLGCEPREGATNPELEQAIELVQLASRGHVPADRADEFDPVEIDAFRQATLAEARPHLESVIGAGTPEEQVTARQMLANIHADAARAQATEAANAAARLAGDTVRLAAQLRRVGGLHNRIQIFRQDRSVIQQQLEEEMQQQDDRLEQLVARQRELEDEIEQLTEQRDDHRQRAGEASGEAHDLRDRAFTLDGDEHYEMLDEAAAAERRAAEADVEADRIAVTLERRRAELAAVEAEQAEIERVLEDLADQIEKWEQREQSRAEQLERLGPEHARAAGELLERFEHAQARYQEQVHQPFIAAAERMAEAIELLETAADQTSGTRRVSVQRDLLTHRVAHVQRLGDHIAAAGSFGRTLAPLAQRAPAVVPPEIDASQFQRAYQDIADQQQGLILDATEAAQAGQSLASELGNVADERTQRFADRQRPTLARYMERFDQHALE